MRVILSGRGVLLTRPFKALVEQKLAKLGRMRPTILEARVTCAAEKFRRTARLTLHARRRTFSSAATAEDLLAAVDAALAAARRQLRDAKPRRRRARPAGSPGAPTPVA